MKQKHIENNCDQVLRQLEQAPASSNKENLNGFEIDEKTPTHRTEKSNDMSDQKFSL